MCSRRVGLASLLAWISLVGPASGEDTAPAPCDPPEPPTFQEFRYRLSGAIRPLLFWISDGDVGAARIIRRAEGPSRSNYEFLIGSDPRRVPRGINRWGWVWEEQREDGATQAGLVRKIDEKSFKEAQANVGFESEYVFKAIRTEIADGQARAENTVWLVAEDYTYYDVEELLHLVRGTPQAPPHVNEGEIPPGTHPGILFAAGDLVERAVTAATQEPRVLLEDVMTHYNFNAVVLDLRLRKAEWEDSKEYGDRRYERLLRMEFESYDPKLDETEKFTLVCGTEGEWRGVPVYMKYQPKWWFKTEGVLDETQVFERPQEQAHRFEPGDGEGEG